jgi:hypothetical protein
MGIVRTGPREGGWCRATALPVGVDINPFASELSDRLASKPGNAITFLRYRPDGTQLHFYSSTLCASGGPAALRLARSGT